MKISYIVFACLIYTTICPTQLKRENEKKEKNESCKHTVLNFKYPQHLYTAVRNLCLNENNPLLVRNFFLSGPRPYFSPTLGNGVTEEKEMIFKKFFILKLKKTKTRNSLRIVYENESGYKKIADNNNEVNAIRLPATKPAGSLYYKIYLDPTQLSWGIFLCTHTDVNNDKKEKTNDIAVLMQTHTQLAVCLPHSILERVLPKTANFFSNNVIDFSNIEPALQHIKNEKEIPILNVVSKYLTCYSKDYKKKQEKKMLQH